MRDDSSISFSQVAAVTGLTLPVPLVTRDANRPEYRGSDVGHARGAGPLPPGGRAPAAPRTVTAGA